MLSSWWKYACRNCCKIPISLIETRKGEQKAHTCANAFHEKAGRSQVHSGFILLGLFFRWARRRCRHASIRTLEERWFRSVQVGRSRFSRCCHLIGALWFCSSRVEPGPGVRRSHRNSALGFCLFSSWNVFDFVLSLLFTPPP